MKKAAAQQVTFKGGMIEGVKQDVPFEQGNGMLQSVLWLENYNHTLQEDSAIKRWGEVDSGVPYLDLGFYSPNTTYNYVLGGAATETDKGDQIEGIQIYSVVHPEYNDNYTTFLKRYPNTGIPANYDYIPKWIRDEGTLVSSEAVALVSHTIAKDGDSPAWQEVWADNYTDGTSDPDYPGWYAFGTLADVTRYGETLLFTTTLNDVPYFDTAGTKNPANDYLYPVYRYLYWDIRKKWKGDNQFLNGIADYNDAALTDPANAAKFAKWKILPPAQYVINTAQVGITNGVQGGTVATNYDGTTTKYDINISIEECVLVGYKAEPTDEISVIYEPSWINTSYLNVKNVTLKYRLLPSSTVFSVEELDLPKVNDKIYGNYSALEEEPNTAINCYESTSAWNEFHRTKNLPNQRLGKAAERIDAVIGKFYTGSYVDSHYMLCLQSMEKYTETENPRLWLYKETIDMVLTANIGGIEVLLWKGTYAVKQEPMQPLAAASSPYIDIPTGGTFYGLDEFPYNQLDYGLNIYADTDIGDMTTGDEVQVTGRGTISPNFRSIGTPVTTVRPPYSTKPYQVAGTLLYFTVDIKQEMLEKLVDISCSSLSLWAVKPDSNRHTLKSIGTNVEAPSGNIYNKPQSQGNEAVDYTKYALLKKFVLDGRTEPVTNYKDWIPGSTLSSNAWNVRFDSADYYHVAVPMYSLEDAPLSGATGTPLYPNDANVTLYLDDPVTNNFWGAGAPYWTPDFVIWDYPTETTLFLNSSGKYWKGLGARLITVIKGRTFIGGCIGADGIEEQAILRYSDVQGGAISPDIFSEERKIQVGHIPHTALLEFREQLWTFSRYQFYRIGLASITQEETWEFFDVVEQGCFNNKSVVVVPYGVCFCNEAGVWLSEGGEPTNLALPILPTYQHISSGTEYLYTTINQLDGVPYIDEKAVNPYLELNYDSFNDEILVSTPLFEDDTHELATTDLTLIFSFKYKSWRVESSLVPEYTNGA